MFNNIPVNTHILLIYKAMPFVPRQTPGGIENALNVIGARFKGVSDNVALLEQDSEGRTITWRVPVVEILQVGTIDDPSIVLAAGRLS